MPSGVLASGLPLWSTCIPLSRGSVLDHLSLIEHEMQAVTEELDDGEEDSHGAAVEQHGEDAWGAGLGAEGRALWPARSPEC